MPGTKVSEGESRLRREEVARKVRRASRPKQEVQQQEALERHAQLTGAHEGKAHEGQRALWSWAFPWRL